MKIGILGATGAVGRQMIQCLEEQSIPVDELRLFASARSAGGKLPFKGQDIVIEEVNETCFAGLDVVFGAVSNALAKQYAPHIVAAGALFIDNSSAFRLEDDVPLVVPEINGEDAKVNKGIIANPNCSTIIALMGVAPIHRLSPIKRMVAATYQAVSGAGNGGITELAEEIEAIRTAQPVTPSVFPYQIAYNCIPFIGSLKENGYTTEEMKMVNEGRKILHAPELRVSCTCVRVPVYRSHSISVSLECERAVSVAEAAEALKNYPGVVYMEDGYPTPLQTSDQDLVYVGRLRKDEIFDGGLSLWCCGDQIRKGAAANAVGILKYLVENK